MILGGGLGWAKYIPLVAGLATNWLTGADPSWRRLLTAGALGLAFGAAADMAYPYLMGMPHAAVEHLVMVPVVAPYGLSIIAVVLLPIAILAAMVSAKRAAFRPRPPNDLRN